MMVAIFFFVVLGALLGTVLGYAAKVFEVEGDPLVDQIEALLPGGQCGQCGEAGCRIAAEKMAQGLLKHNCCPPGGSAVSAAIANLVGVTIADVGEVIPTVAVIDEENCSGCGRCYKACPFDAIVGANKQMHTVVKSVCTGCELCSKVCPQGCLTMKLVEKDTLSWIWPNPDASHNSMRSA